MKKATRSNFKNNRRETNQSEKTNSATFEPLEDRRLMSQVSLVDGMLILQGNAHGHNRLSVSPDADGQHIFAHANKVKEHFLLKDIKTIRVVGGETSDDVRIDKAISKSSTIRTGDGADYASGGSGSDTIIGGKGPDTLLGNAGDDLIISRHGRNHVDAGAGDNPNKIYPHSSTAYPVAVTSFRLINATTNQTIGTIQDGATLNLASLPKKLNIQAMVSDGGDAGSVRFTYDGQEINPVENVAPFALAGDTKGDFKNWTPRVGKHTLRAVPYAGKDISGASGTDKMITFTVVDDPDSAVPQEIDDGGNDNGGNGNGGGGTVVNQQNAPTAVITTLDNSVAAGMAIHVNGLRSTLKVGDPLGAKYEWDFGDAGSKYNSLIGFNAAHAYTKPGTYTITLKVTNAAGASDSVTTQVTITDANRRFIYVSPKGNDANNGSSPGNAVKTFKRASDLVGDNTEVLFERGATYTTKDAMILSFNNVAVGAYGTGAAPVIKYTGGNDYGTIFSTLGAKDVLVHNLTFDSTNTSTGFIGYNDVIRIGGQNVTFRDNSITNSGYVINSNGSPDGLLVQDNTVTKKNGMRGYFAWVQGSDEVYVGNTVPDSLDVHIMRIGGADRVLVAHNSFSKSATTADRPTIAVHKGSYIYVGENTLSGDCVEVGPLNGADGLSDASARAKWIVLENNTIKDANVELLHGIEHLSIRNNVVMYDSGTAFDLYGYNQQYQRGSSDVFIVHNTVINNDTMGRFLKVGGPVDGVTVSNNLYVAPHLEVGPNDAAPVLVADGGLSSFRLVSDNVWPSPTIDPDSDPTGGINMVGTA